MIDALVIMKCAIYTSTLQVARGSTGVGSAFRYQVQNPPDRLRRRFGERAQKEFFRARKNGVGVADAALHGARNLSGKQPHRTPELNFLTVGRGNGSDGGQMAVSRNIEDFVTFPSRLRSAPLGHFSLEAAAKRIRTDQYFEHSAVLIGFVRKPFPIR